MHVRSFQELKVWEKAHKMVLELYQTTNVFPRHERFGLTSQIRRSSVSVCANMAEGYKKSTKDFIRYLEISEGSLEETKYHLIFRLGQMIFFFNKFIDGNISFCRRQSMNVMAKYLQ